MQTLPSNHSSTGLDVMASKIITFIILVPVAIVLIVLSVANRGSVTLALNPFQPADTVLSVTAPFFVFLFVTFMLGMIAGSMATWLKQGKYRKKARVEAREAVRWHSEADKQRERAESVMGQNTLPSA